MRKLLWIGLAGAAGAIIRVVIGRIVSNDSGFPFSTLTVNIVGTFLLCFIVAGAVQKLVVHKELQDIVTSGFLGSFTTFSAVSMETVLLIQKGQIIVAGLYIIFSVIGGISVGMLGFRLGRKRVRT
ncbi:CrcB family protein [Sporosarcina sp. ANT_H38]|uniref:fluoride efflux transporter FluC n=1 Tax=Sporosarcina sp. ANT_H38 TaxID=2597358 RepID=UPI0011F245ED|nr:CrcB family protein [Sporosarcina sp. ANT_H38]KAA0964814.1 CrcB family protein [Sporosarcina sp. ANT_H38]